MDYNYAYEERAAILEYDAGFSREEAERMARAIEKERMETFEDLDG